MTFPGLFEKYFPPWIPCCFVWLHTRCKIGNNAVEMSQAFHGIVRFKRNGKVQPVASCFCSPKRVNNRILIRKPSWEDVLLWKVLKEVLIAFLQGQIKLCLSQLWFNSRAFVVPVIRVDFNDKSRKSHLLLLVNLWKFFSTYKIKWKLKSY